MKQWGVEAQQKKYVKTRPGSTLITHQLQLYKTFRPGYFFPNTHINEWCGEDGDVESQWDQYREKPFGVLRGATHKHIHTANSASVRKSESKWAECIMLASTQTGYLLIPHKLCHD